MRPVRGQVEWLPCGNTQNHDQARLVFGDTTVEVVDDCKDYGERRIVCYGHLEGRVVAIG